MTTQSLSSALKELVLMQRLVATTSCICTSRKEMQGSA